MKPERIVVFGDSYSYGQGLDGTNIAHPTPHPQAWPFVLGKQLDIPVLNCSMPGLSNKLIMWAALNFPVKETDLVVFCWSCPQRTATISDFDVAANEDYIRQQLSGGKTIIEQYGNWMDDQPHVMYYYGNIYNDTDAILTTMGYMDHIDLKVKQITPYCYHTTIPNILEYELLHLGDSFQPSPSDEVFLKDRPNWFNIDIIATMTYEKFNIGECDDGHLSIESNAHFANKVAKIIKPDLT